MPRHPELARLLNSARLAQHRTQQDVAAAAGLSVGYYGHIERGARRPTPELLAEMGRVLRLDFAQAAAAAGYAPQSIGETVITVDDSAKAAQLRLLAQYDVAELQRLVAFAAEWLPGR